MRRLAAAQRGWNQRMRRLLSAFSRYPSASETFPPLHEDAFQDAVRVRERPICACVRCRVVVPSSFSTGACPVCASSVDYYDVGSDADAEMALAALAPGVPLIPSPPADRAGELSLADTTCPIGALSLSVPADTVPETP
jgi:hypothetical protein